LGAGVTRALAFALTLAASPAAELKPDTRRAFDGYLEWNDARVQSELRNGSPFLFAEGFDERRRKSVESRLRRGDIVTEDLRPSDLQVPDGMIHHWVSAVFLPGVTMKQTVALLLDFDSYARIHEPYFQRSKLIARDGNHYRVYLRLYRRKFLQSLTTDTEHDVHFQPVDAARAVCRTQAVKIQEIDDAGDSNERPTQPGKERGYLWRYVSYYRVAERDGGTFLQIEALSLSRDLFFGISSFLRGVHKDLLEDMVRNTRAALLAKKK
jgi:hypothetical protein